jgi:exodeoxyribonuclease VII small subunit
MRMTLPSQTGTFTEHTQALGGILERFRQEALPLEDALTLFEVGVAHIKTCQAQLNQAKGRFMTIQEALLANEPN